jgi:hypothetical protein
MVIQITEYYANPLSNMTAVNNQGKKDQSLKGFI